MVVYYNGLLPVFTHAVDDTRSFRMITAQFCVSGYAKQVDIARAFHVPLISMKRAVKRFRERGPAGFYAPRKTRGPAVLTPPVVAEAESLLSSGKKLAEVAIKLGLKRNTLRKAIAAGRVRAPVKTSECDATEAPCESSSKSERTALDSSGPMGVAAVNVERRVESSLGQAGPAIPTFQSCLDVANAGVLLGLPALLSSGLLRHTGTFFELPNGYYGLQTIIMLLAFMALARIKSVESLRYSPPGEWGKIFGLDRIPEVRTLRNKIATLCSGDGPVQWGSTLCKEWMNRQFESAAVLYVDGHVRVYHGKQTRLPRRHVARQKLCLRGTTDYWVNAMDGQPFMVITQPVDPGLIKVIENEIVPRLEREVPHQASPEELENDPDLHRFTLVFDREGYSPAFWKRLKKRHIACISYHKYPDENWPVDDFKAQQVELASGEIVEMKLAERRTLVGKKLWVREVRKRTDSDHQTAVISTEFKSDMRLIAARMFARWSQENFFRYMRQNYSLDRLVDYGTENIPDTTQVVNPEHRQLDRQVRSAAAKIGRQRAEFGAIVLDDDIEPDKVEHFQLRKAELQEGIEDLQRHLAELKAKRKATQRHIPIAELPEGDRFMQLSSQSKHFIDMIKMIAYRAETAMSHVVRERMSRGDDARSLLRSVYSTEADLQPDNANHTLTVRIHRQATASADAAVAHLCDELTATETVFPGTDLRLIYELVSSQNP